MTKEEDTIKHVFFRIYINFCLLSEPQRYTSEATSSKDDATAYVSCPPGMMAVECECEKQYCDGAWFKADECQVTNSAKGSTSKVRK